MRVLHANSTKAVNASSEQTKCNARFLSWQEEIMDKKNVSIVVESDKKPFWKSKKFWIIFAVIFIIIVAIASSGEPTTETKTISETETIKCETKRVDDDTLEKGQEVTETECQDGERTVEYEVTIENDKETSRKKLSEKVTKEPVEGVVRAGTKEAEPELPPISTPEPTPTPNPTPSPNPNPNPGPSQPPQQKFANCTELRKVYPNGVGRAGAVDQVSSGAPVTNFTVNDALYNSLNGNFDRDNDGIACEA
jgi:hypothetical protein